MKAIGKIIGSILIGTLPFTGCSSKKIEISDDSMKVLNSYNKKTLPEFYFWNFGTGSSYSEALKDAQKSMLVKDYNRIDYSVYKTSNNVNVTAENHKVFTGDKMCEIHKNLKVPEGYMIIRICKDNSAEILDSRNDKPFVADQAWIYKLDTFLKREMQSGNLKKEERAALKEFISNHIYRNDIGQQFLYNFQYHDFEEILDFIIVDFRKWYEDRRKYLPPMYEEQAYYPYSMHYNSYGRNSDWSQLWQVTGTKFVFCMKDQLSAPAMLGLVEIPEKTKIEYIGLKKPKKDDF